MKSYSSEDQIWGLILIIKHKREDLLLQVWDTMIVDERHFFNVFEEIVKL